MTVNVISPAVLDTVCIVVVTLPTAVIEPTAHVTCAPLAVQLPAGLAELKLIPLGNVATVTTPSAALLALRLVTTT